MAEHYVWTSGDVFRDFPRRIRAALGRVIAQDSVHVRWPGGSAKNIDDLDPGRGYGPRLGALAKRCQEIEDFLFEIERRFGASPFLARLQRNETRDRFIDQQVCALTDFASGLNVHLTVAGHESKRHSTRASPYPGGRIKSDWQECLDFSFCRTLTDYVEGLVRSCAASLLKMLFVDRAGSALRACPREISQGVACGFRFLATGHELYCPDCRAKGETERRLRQQQIWDRRAEIWRIASPADRRTYLRDWFPDCASDVLKEFKWRATRSKTRKLLGFDQCSYRTLLDVVKDVRKHPWPTSQIVRGSRRTKH
ncbi:MAG: hypothetical protein IT462_14290 [Planctomycetes bacterium]|nr:hypothetical protein [Planctomycetota bacterium]